METTAEDLKKKHRSDYLKAYYVKNKDKYRAACIKYSQSPKGKKFAREYYAKNREILIQKAKDRYYRIKQEKGL